MPLSRLGLSLCLPLLLLAGQAGAQVRTPAPAPAEPVLIRQHDCFQGTFRSYDRWMDFLAKKNNPLATLAIRWKFPEQRFERYRRELDCRLITYRSDQHVVQAWLVQPRQRKGRKRPIVIYNRGGNRELGALTFAHLFAHVLPMAEQGYVVAASQYRGVDPAPGETVSPDQFGGDDVRDVTHLMKLVIRLPQADPGNVYMIGQSRGSIMTFRALLDPPVPVRAVAIYSGVYDLHDLLEFRPEFDGLFEELIPEYRTHRQAALDRRSVTRWPSQLPAATGVLLIHGEADERAPLSSARKFDRALESLGRPHKAIFLPGESHFLDGGADRVRAETLGWFRRFGARPTPVPSAPAS